MAKKEIVSSVWKFRLGQASTEISRMVKSDDGKGIVRIVSGTRTGDLEVEIDFDAIRLIGHAALRNKSRTTRFGNGAVIVRAMAVEDLERK